MTAVSYENMEGKKAVPEQPRPYSSTRWRCCLITYAITITLVAGVTGFFLYAYMNQGGKVPATTQVKGPEYAECSVTWYMKAARCAEVNKAIEEQILEWNMDAECGPGRECLYQLTSNDGTYLDGTHTTPVYRFVDAFHFTVHDVESDDCYIEGFSESLFEGAVLDGGANYCNVHNLMYGPNVASLTPEIEETTDDDICTQKSSADCNMVMNQGGKGPVHMTQGGKGPDHAECSVTWNMTGVLCAEVNDAIQRQILEWNMDAECGPGRECLYQLTSKSATYLDGNHTTPIRRFVDDFHFKFPDVESNYCFIEGFSESQLDIAKLDGGANYCNVHNLMYGPNVASLIDTSLIEEITDNDICTQHSIADCTMV